MHEDTPTDRAEHSATEPVARTDGGRSEERAATDGGTAAGTTHDHRSTDYLDSEVNLLRPSTSFMRDHLRVVWTGFLAWALLVFGPVTLTAIAPGVMTTEIPMLGFPLHYFAVAIGAPTSALLLSVWYARKRDALDTKYGIEHTTTERTESDDEVAAADGGVAK